MAKTRTHKKHTSHKNKQQVAYQLFIMILIIIWQYIRIGIDCLIDFIFSFYYNNKSVKIPPVKHAFLLESACTLAAGIRNRKYKSEEIVRAFVERAVEVNRIINAVTDQRYAAAIEEAIQIDRDIKSGAINEGTFKTKPFLGVPFTTKESTACAGLSYTFGMVSRRSVRAEEDAEVIALMKRAGGILIANTNIPELNLWQETRNMLYGQTLNPYDTCRTVGGSSGGEAALIASCGSPCGIGTDIGGSIRMPAYFCGLFGHKPTSYLVPTKGLTQRTGKEKHTMLVAGPMCRKAEDLAPMLKILVSGNIDRLKLDHSVDISSLKYFYIEESNDLRVSSVCTELKQLMQKVVSHFMDELSDDGDGDNVTQLDIPELRYSSRLWRYWMSQEPCRFSHELANRNGKVNGWLELYRKLTGTSQFSMAAIIKLLDDKLPKENEKWAQETTKIIRDKLLNELEKNGVLFYPSYTWPASYHYTAFFRPYNFNYWSIFNVLQFPVTQVPLGLSRDGLPMGLQVVAAPYNDHLCITVAKHLETTFGGFVPPFKSN